MVQQLTEQEQRQYQEAVAAARSRNGVVLSRRVSASVDRSLIRIWAIACRWPDPLDRIHWDDEYAKKTRHRDIVAPRFFNPFAWHIDESRMDPKASVSGSQNVPPAGTTRGTRMMNGGMQVRYGAPIRPGDVITSETVQTEVFERDTSMGPTYFVVTENTWSNQKGEMVQVSRNTLIRY